MGIPKALANLKEFKDRSSLQRSAMMAVAFGASQQSLDDLSAAFLEMDTNGDGACVYTSVYDCLYNARTSSNNSYTKKTPFFYLDLCIADVRSIYDCSDVIGALFFACACRPNLVVRVYNGYEGARHDKQKRDSRCV